MHRTSLVVLVADKDIEWSLRGLFTRYRALKIRQLAPDQDVVFHRHPHHDPGCVNGGCDFLRPFSRQFDHALMVFDLEGCGKEGNNRTAVEEEVEGRLRASGWGERAAAVVIDPELEAWVWSNSPHVATVLGWEDIGSMKNFLENEGFDFSLV